MKNPSTRKRGDDCELAALDHLRSLGYRILSTNYRTRFGELDIVAEDGQTVVFVEVKGRVDGGDPLDSMTEIKVARVRRMAEAWQARHNAWERDVRCDVILVRRSPAGEYAIEHLKEAF